MTYLWKGLAASACTVTTGLLLVGCGGGRTPMLPPKCEIRFSPTTVSFGKVTPGNVGSQQVWVTNLGGAECLLSNAGLSPTSDPSFELAAIDAFTINPGAKVSLEVLFRPTAAKLPLLRYGALTFESNAENASSVTIPLAAEIQTDCRLDVSPTAVDFGHVALGDSAPRSVQVTNKGTGPCELRDISLAPGSDAQFHLDSTAQLALEPGEQQSINLSFRADDPAKPHHRTGSLTASTSDSAKATLAIPLSADIDVGCELSWTPAELNFGNVTLNGKADGHVTLSNDGSDTCYVANLAITKESDPDFRLGNNPATFTVAPGGSATIAMVFLAEDSLPPHLKTGTLTFDTGNKRQPRASVPLSGYVTTVCIEASRWIYTVDNAAWLTRFDPSTFTFTDIAQLRCPDTSGTMSMAVDQNAVAWVLYGDGNLFKVDTTTGACEATGFKAYQHNISIFGMGFVFDPSTGQDTLYIADYSTLATISFPNLVVTPIASISAGLPELTGTGDGQLWGFSQTYSSGNISAPTLFQFDPKSGATLKSYAYTSMPVPRSWAMKFWGGSFWMFADAAVYRAHRESPSKAEFVGTYPRGNGIVGAGVSTCAPLQ